ncbi:diguanylate cyclase [Cohnella pontilimi]|uniref:Diguanylate cyclase n=1 Tax=Cohnella pontilimi TaxID=2564100 RepID=A0A4V5LS69_9BACL|nr:diguanylate cyclase [Cohnella pontilimi]TJY41939.1 diguanylate cyclase [Cohnella pontilimi]
MDTLFHASDLHQLVFDSLFEPAVIINRDGIIKSVNPAWRQFPWFDDETLENYLDQSYLELYQDQENLLAGITRVLQATEMTYNQKVIHGAYSFTVNIMPLKNQGSEVIGALIVYMNTTEQTKLEEIFVTGAKQFRLIAEHSNDMITVTDATGNVEYVSPSHEVILGYIDQSNIFDSVHPEDAVRFKRLSNEILETKESRKLELRKKHRNGNWIWVETVCSPVLSDENKVQNLVFITREITDRKQLQNELERMAYYDFLTGLYNRRRMRMAMDEVLESSAKNDEQFAILIMDLDKFKWINDSHGHDAGDLVLKEFANRLLSCKGDTEIVGRLGGDEFCVVMNAVHGRESIHQFIHRFQQALIEPYTFPNTDESILIKSSVGYALYPSHGDSVKSLLKYADNALYKEKRMPFNGKATKRLRKKVNL